MKALNHFYLVTAGTSAIISEYNVDPGHQVPRYHFSGLKQWTDVS